MLSGNSIVPSGISGIRELIDNYGWVGRDGRRAFRKTFSGSKDEFTISSDGKNLIFNSNKIKSFLVPFFFYL